MGKITRTWSLMADSWQVLKLDKSLVLFPFISSICCLLLMASFAVPICATGAWHPPTHDAETQRQILYYGTLFVFYVLLNFIVVFFNAALVACAATRMGGGQPTLADGLRAAAARLPVIVGWALVSATVGLILRIIEDRSSRVGQIIAGILGAAWTVMTFLVVPILVIENKNPIAALQESTVLLKKTWGERLTSNLSFHILLLLLLLPAFGLAALGIAMGNSVALLTCMGLAAIYAILVMLVYSALHAIFQTALYLYTRDGVVPQGFREDVLGAVLR
ncbi:MAG TPA: DUF6159 family protein [Alphaproteobacteria bacterium]|nr:DUF6159 family protein [Alphaproteobacteria bacterium]